MNTHSKSQLLFRTFGAQLGSKYIGSCVAVLLTVSSGLLSSACQDAVLEMGEDEGVRQDHNRENPLGDAQASNVELPDAGTQTASEQVDASVVNNKPAPRPSRSKPSDPDDTSTPIDTSDPADAAAPPNEPQSTEGTQRPADEHQDPVVPNEVQLDALPDAAAPSPGPDAATTTDAAPSVTQFALRHAPGCNPTYASAGADTCTFGVQCDDVTLDVFCNAAGSLHVCYASRYGATLTDSERLLLWSESSIHSPCEVGAMLLEQDFDPPNAPSDECAQDQSCTDTECIHADACGATYDLGDGVRWIDAEPREVRCNSASATTYCACDGFGTIDSSYFATGQSLSERTARLLDFCSSDAPLETGETTCTTDSLNVQDGECSSSAICLTPMERAGGASVQRHLAKSVRCSPSEEGTHCELSGGEVALTFQDPQAVTDACLDAQELWNQNDMVPTSTEVCTGVQIAAAEAKCEASIQCALEGLLGDTVVTSRNTYRLECIPSSDGGYACASPALNSALDEAAIPFDIDAETIAGACKAAVTHVIEQRLPE